MHLSCSPNFPRASITRYMHAKHEQILKFSLIVSNKWQLTVYFDLVMFSVIFEKRKVKLNYDVHYFYPLFLFINLMRFYNFQTCFRLAKPPDYILMENVKGFESSGTRYTVHHKIYCWLFSSWLHVTNKYSQTLLIQTLRGPWKVSVLSWLNLTL